VIKPWRDLGSRNLASTWVFRLDAHRRVSEQSGREAEFYVLHAADWVNVVALTEDERLVFVEQYRHGTREVTLEIPGGVVDASDPSPEAAARRELLEETGYSSDSWRLIGTVTPNPAILSNRCFTFLAAGARRVAEPSPDATEEIVVVLHDAARVNALLQEGRITHALVVAALQWWTLAG
jgi:8-oxo-dGTP pyrophosphatase MutT (NUDIX family)